MTLPQDTNLGYLSIGLLAQGLFFARFFVQWLASEREKRCVVPVLFWHLSIAGSVLLLVYSLARRDLVFFLIPIPNLVIYVRNLVLSSPTKTKDRQTGQANRKWAALAIGLMVLALVAGLVFGKNNLLTKLQHTPWQWVLIGFAGQLLWDSRFIIQLIASEQQGRSTLPRSFWYTSLGGSFLLLLYAIHRHDPVFIIAMAPNAIIYLRNLYLLNREKETSTWKKLFQTIKRPEILTLLVLTWMLIGYLGASNFRGWITESRRSEVAREIVEGPGSWLIPTLKGKPFLTKPPLYYDLVAGSIQTLGVNETAARLPAALFSLLALWATYIAGKTWRNRRVGLLAAAMLATTVSFVQNCRLAEIDAVLLGAISASLAMIHLALRGDSRQKQWILGLWITMGIGFLIKGPHAVMFPLCGLFLTAVAVKREIPNPSQPFPKFFPLGGILLFLAIVLPWFAYMLHTVPEARAVFQRETIGRIPALAHFFPSPPTVSSGKKVSSIAHAEPFWFYFEKLPDLLPWLPIAIAGGIFAWKRKKTGDRFGVLYLLGGFFMLSLITSKKAVYLLPLAPQMALLGADTMGTPWQETSRAGKTLRRGTLFLGILGLATASILTPFALFMLWKTSWTLSGTIAILLTGILGLLLAGRSIKTVRAKVDLWRPTLDMLLALSLGISLVFHHLKPYADAQRSYKEFARELARATPSDANLVLYHTKNYAMMYYSRRTLHDSPIEEITPETYVLVERKHMENLEKQFLLRLVVPESHLPKKTRKQQILVQVLAKK